MTALEVAGLTHRFGDRVALHDVSFAVLPGGFTVLLGPNGAGKTTLFALITRLYHAHEGRIAVFGRDFRADRDRPSDTQGGRNSAPRCPRAKAVDPPGRERARHILGRKHAQDDVARGIDSAALDGTPADAQAGQSMTTGTSAVVVSTV